MRKCSTRRRFLQRSAAVTAAAMVAPSILPSTAFGQNAPSQRINLGLIGVGGRGSALTGGFIHLPDAQFLAVCDCFRDRRERMRDSMNAHYGSEVVTAHADFREVLGRPDVDAVIVATPDHWHVPIAIAAARAGKDMYVEKPLGVSLAWAKVLRETLRETGRVFQYGTQQRSIGFYRRCWEMVNNGYIGEVTHADAWCPDISSQYEMFNVKQWGATEPAEVPEGFDYDMWLGPAPESPYTLDRCTCFGTYHHYDNSLGFIAGWGAHPLDAVQWVLGKDDTSPVRYEGTGTLPKEGLYRTIGSWDMQCTYGNGQTIRLMSHRVARPVVESIRGSFVENGVLFHGTEGWVSADRGRFYASDPRLLDLALRESDRRPKISNDHHAEFLRCVKERALPVSHFEAAMRSDTISHCCDLAIRRGKTLAWDPARECITNDGRANEQMARPIRPPWDLAKPLVSREG